jgi:hypothetical protein
MNLYDGAGVDGVDVVTAELTPLITRLIRLLCPAFPGRKIGTRRVHECALVVAFLIP